MPNLYMWTAGSGCGVSGELGQAQRAAADFLPGGHGQLDARIEEARTGFLTSVPERTGSLWRPWRRPDGSVRWWPSYLLEAAA